MEIRLSGHTTYRTEYHIIWIPEYRHRILNTGVKGYLMKLFPKVMEQMPGCEIVKISIQVDHIYMIMIIPPKYAVSEIVGKMKGMTSIELRKKSQWLKNHYFHENVIWSPGFFVSTVGVDENKIMQYVEYQGRQDSGQAKLEI